MKTLAVEMSVDAALVFYKVCEQYKLTTIEQRNALLQVFVDEKIATRAFTTNRTPEQVIKDLAKHQTILQISKKVKSGGKANG